MKKSDILRICLWILIFGIFYSCRAKKSESDKKEEISTTDMSGISKSSGNSEETINSVSNLQTKAITTVDDQNHKVTTKVTVSPINPALPASFTSEQGKKYDLNNASYTEEKTIEKNNTKTENSQNSEETIKSKLAKKETLKSTKKIQIKKKNKKLHETESSEHKAWQFPWHFWLIILAIILFVMAYLNKRYRWLNYVTSLIVKLFQIRKK